MAGENREEGREDVGRPQIDEPEVKQPEQGPEAAPPDTAGHVGAETRPAETETYEPGGRKGAPPPDLNRQTVDERQTRPVWMWVVLGLAVILVLAWLFLVPGQ